MDLLSKIYFYICNDTLSYLKQFIVSLLVSVLVFMLGYRFDINSLYNKLELAQKQALTTNELIQNKRKIVQQSNATRTKNFSMKTIWQSTEELASGLEFATILNLLVKGANAAHIEPDLFEPQPIQKRKQMSAYPLNLELNGSYKNLLLFIDQLLRQPYLIALDEMVLQKNRMNNRGTLNMKISMTVYKTKMFKHSPLTINIATRDIFQQPKNHVGLHLWASCELRFLGSLKQGQNVYGIISDPMGETYRVVVGDKIGLNQSRITAINSNVIITNNVSDNIHRGE